MGKTKQKNHKPDEDLLGQIREQKKEIRKLLQQIRSLEKDLNYNQNKTDKLSEKRIKKPDLDTCELCGKGYLRVSDLGIRTLTRCSICPYTKVTK